MTSRPAATRLRLVPCLIAVFAGLTACGGGGSDRPNVAPTVPAAGQRLAINQSNHEQLVGASVVGVNQVAGLSETVTLVGVQANAAVSLGAALQGSLKWLQLPMSEPAVLTGAVQVSLPIPCRLGGTVSRSLDDLNGSRVPDSAGESVTLTLNNCNDGAGQTVSGTLIVVLNAPLTGNLNGAPFSLDATLGLADFSITSGGLTLSARGRIQLIASSQSATRSSSRLVIPALAATLVGGGASLTLSIHDADLLDTLNGTTVSSVYAATVSSSEFGGQSVRVTTPTAILTDVGAPYPRAGTLLITGANNSRVRVLPQTDAATVKLELDADGDNTYETTSTVAWSTLI